ncbi:hypothetical protein GGR56DRAFT_537057 [Xylariaceae sp. FL0804]|nr:hypothetical protein GGR56DRAFT_537057 [Xylariaceae sp. FL0804]
MVEAVPRLGTESHAAVLGGRYLEETDFVDIQDHMVRLPVIRDVTENEDALSGGHLRGTTPAPFNCSSRDGRLMRSRYPSKSAVI